MGAPQYRALAQMRWRMLLNSLRTPHGQFELGAQLLSIAFFSLVGLAVFTVCSLLARQFASDDNLNLLPNLLWPILAAWLLLPLLLGSFGETPDLTFLLRFPVSFHTYVNLFLLSGFFDPSSLLCGLALLGVWLGAVTGQPQLLASSTFSLSLFAVFSFLLSKTLLIYLDRWLSRQYLKIFFALALTLLLALSLLHPRFALSWFPPNLAASAMAAAAEVYPLGLLALYAMLIAALLRRRLHAEFHGQNLAALSQSARPAKVAAFPRAFTPGKPSPLKAVLRKELHYLSRSGPMIFILSLPPVLVWFISGSSSKQLGPTAPYVLPLWTAFAFMPLTRQVCNSLGAESSGIQLYFLSPTPLRTVMLGKNLLHVVLFLSESLVVCSIVLLRIGPPSLEILTATFCWLLFALPLQLSFGNLLSLTMPYRMTLTRVSGEPGATGNGLLSLLLQFVLLGLGCAIYFLPASLGPAALPDIIFLLLAGAGACFWLLILARVDRIAADRRMELFARLVRAA